MSSRNRQRIERAAMDMAVDLRGVEWVDGLQCWAVRYADGDADAAGSADDLIQRMRRKAPKRTYPKPPFPHKEGENK